MRPRRCDPGGTRASASRAHARSREENNKAAGADSDLRLQQRPTDWAGRALGARFKYRCCGRAHKPTSPAPARWPRPGRSPASSSSQRAVITWLSALSLRLLSWRLPLGGAACHSGASCSFWLAFWVLCPTPLPLYKVALARDGSGGGCWRGDRSLFCHWVAVRSDVSL